MWMWKNDWRVDLPENVEIWLKRFIVMKFFFKENNLNSKSCGKTENCWSRKWTKIPDDCRSESKLKETCSNELKVVMWIWEQLSRIFTTGSECNRKDPSLVMMTRKFKLNKSKIVIRVINYLVNRKLFWNEYSWEETTFDNGGRI